MGDVIRKILVNIMMFWFLFYGLTYSQEQIEEIQKGVTEPVPEMIHEMGHNAWIYREGKNRDMFVVEFSKKVVNNTNINNRHKKIDYIRGYFDAEGSIPRSENVRFYIYFSQKNKEDLEQLKSYITELGIMCGKTHNPSKRIDPKYWRFYVSCKSYEEFIEKIGSWHPVKKQSNWPRAIRGYTLRWAFTPMVPRESVTMMSVAWLN